MSPSSGRPPLNAGAPSRSPVGTAMLAASIRKHIAECGPAWGGPALGPQRAPRTHTTSGTH